VCVYIYIYIYLFKCICIFVSTCYMCTILLRLDEINKDEISF
jgi:hypothetical protein